MNPYGRPKVAQEFKAVKISVSLRPAQIEYVKKSGGSKYIQGLIDKDMEKSTSSTASEKKPQETAKNLDADSILIRRLKGLSQNFTREKP